MVSRVRTVAFHGIEIMPIDVQVQAASGMPSFTIVGLPDKAVAESRERVRAALTSIGLALPPKRITVNLSPADVLKEGSHFDLPIALGLLLAMEVLADDALDGYTVLGELALDGAVTPVTGVLAAAIGSGAERGIVCPEACGGEVCECGGNGFAGCGARTDGVSEITALGTLAEIVNEDAGVCEQTGIEFLLVRIVSTDGRDETSGGHHVWRDDGLRCRGAGYRDIAGGDGVGDDGHGHGLNAKGLDGPSCESLRIGGLIINGGDALDWKDA